MLSVADIKAIFLNTTAGYKSIEDELFTANNEEFFGSYKKLGVICCDTQAEDDAAISSEVAFGVDMSCNQSINCCQLNFETTVGYNSHYNSVHRHICSQCRRALPTAHILDLHISELHDSYFAARVDRGDAMFACFLEECMEKMKTAQERKEHCIQVHKFPASYRFDQSQSHTVEEKTEAQTQQSSMQVDEEQIKTSREKAYVWATSDMPKIKAFSFGHQREKTFHGKRSGKQEQQKTVAGQTLENLNNLKDVLSDI